MKKLTLLLLLSSSVFINSCDWFEPEDVCTALSKADLLIDAVIPLVDYFGNPVVNPFTGQQVQSQNVLFYNTRTREYFNNEVPPRFQTFIGDVIEVASQVKNFYQETQCEKLTSAPPTQTQIPFTFNGQPFAIPGATPFLNAQRWAYAVGRFQLPAFGNYNFGTFQADFNSQVDEWNEQNNDMTPPSSGSITGRLDGTGFIISFEGSNPEGRLQLDSREFIASYDQNVKSLESDEFEILNNLDSEAYQDFIQRLVELQNQ